MATRPAFLALVLAASTLPAPSATAEENPRAALYPTDRCVAAKLDAAARACRGVFDALAFQELRGTGPAGDPRLARAREALESAWSDAEETSASQGVDCGQTTETADAVFAVLQDEATGIAAEVRSATSGARFLKGLRAYGGLRASGFGCWGLLTAEARHLRERRSDRDRSRLERGREIAGGWLERLLRWSALGKDGAAAVTERVRGLAGEVKWATTVSPGVSEQFSRVDPDEVVPYLGQTLRPICSRGTDWSFWVRRGKENRVLYYFQGGGACWDYLTCEQIGTFKPSTGPGDDPSNRGGGFADFDDPRNPFRDWHVVFVPYCTGDIHWGSADVEHELFGNTATIRHRGFQNAQVAEKWAREHFVHPDEIFVTGSSAGAYGAILNSLYLQEWVYASTRFSVLGDAGNGIVPQRFLAEEISKWNIEENLPAWITALDKPVTELDASTLWAESAKAYPQNRFANYSTSFDGGSGGQIGFYQVMLFPDVPTAWFDWWRPSCDWDQRMRAQAMDAAAGAPNYRYYIGTGSRHTTWGFDKVYDDTTGGVPPFVDWVQAMRAGSEDWVNVECEDCGTTLPGDPRPPFLPNAPYDKDGNVVCP